MRIYGESYEEKTMAKIEKLLGLMEWRNRMIVKEIM